MIALSSRGRLDGLGPVVIIEQGNEAGGLPPGLARRVAVAPAATAAVAAAVAAAVRGSSHAA